MNLRDTLTVDSVGRLEIGGIDACALAKKYGTPLYVMDVGYIKAVCKAFMDTVDKTYGNGSVAYASKALSCVAIYGIMKELGMCIDVVSGGEIYTALKAGFDIKNAFFHGNNKLENELTLAMDNGIGTIVADNICEAELIESMAAARGIIQRVMVRVNPGVEAHTHSFIQTAKPDSKFGFATAGNAAIDFIKEIVAKPHLRFVGLHCHIGSQIFDKSAFVLAVDKVTDFAATLKKRFGIEVDEMNFGGGFGIHYSDGDPKYNVAEYCGYVAALTAALEADVEAKGLKRPRFIIEPGRSIVGEAGVTLYTVGAIKEIAGIKKYVAVDGGMNDNIRPALYDAKYEAVVASRANAVPTETVTVAGKCCESGDIIIKDAVLPKVCRGDVLAVFSTGAYNYSMASNYNRMSVPPIVFVEDGKSGYAVKPQSLDDIVRNDVIPVME